MVGKTFFETKKEAITDVSIRISRGQKCTIYISTHPGDICKFVVEWTTA